MSEVERRMADLKRVVSQWPMASYKVDALVRAAKAEAWEEGQISLLKYMGVPLYPSKGDEPRNPKQPLNPYRQGETE